eukprot:RCo021499
MCKRDHREWSQNYKSEKNRERKQESRKRNAEIEKHENGNAIQGKSYRWHHSYLQYRPTSTPRPRSHPAIRWCSIGLPKPHRGQAKERISLDRFVLSCVKSIRQDIKDETHPEECSNPVWASQEMFWGSTPWGERVQHSMTGAVKSAPTLKESDLHRCKRDTTTPNT